MIDYRGIEALQMVQELQNFELAAKKLFISQSAVSQRIKALEDHYGEPLLIRTLPYRPTKLGIQLIAHYKKVCLLEEEFDLERGEVSQKPSISIAINRDSLETWFLDLIAEQKDIFQDITLDIIADDQERTLTYLKNGTVSSCLSTQKKEILGGKAAFVGNMHYVLAASPVFVKKYFSSDDFQDAPAIKFDHNDNLHERYLEKYFGMDGSSLKFHVVPSVRGFKQFALLGYGYGLIPKLDILEELKTGQLIQIYSDKTWDIPLYWHTWSVQSPFYQNFHQDMVRLARKKLSY